MLVQEVLAKTCATVGRWRAMGASPARLTRAAKKRREKGLARSGNARVRRGMIQLAWRFLMFQKDSALAHWFYARTKNAPQTRKTMIVALARKPPDRPRRLAREGAIPEGIVLRTALDQRSYIEIFRQLRPASLQAREGADDGSRWRVPDSPPLAFMPERMGPPPRSFAADAHECIMVRSRTDRIQGRGA